MAKFKVGDKVRIVFGDGWIEWVNEMRKFIGEKATISEVSYESDHPWFRVEGHLFHWNECDAELIEQPRREFIVIRRSGAETIAELRHDREVIKSAKATCAPSDTFDLDTVAKLAFDRLMGREEPKIRIVGDEHHGAPQPAHRFNVGDRVVDEIGNTGTVIEIRRDGNIVKRDGCNTNSIYCDSRLSPAPAPEPPKFYTGKVVCIGCDKGAEWAYADRIGRIGVIENGHALWRSFLTNENYTSFEDFCSRNVSGHYIEIKEPSDV